MQLTITVFHQGTPEHKSISQQGLDVAYQTAYKEDSEAEKSLTTATAPKEGYQGTDENLLVIKSW